MRFSKALLGGLLVLPLQSVCEHPSVSTCFSESEEVF